MPDRKARRGKGDKSRQRLRTLLLEDLRQGNFQGTMRRDLREMYDFYLDEDARDRLSAMGRMKRWLHVVIWLLKSLVRKLSPTRRILLIVCLVLYMFSDVARRTEGGAGRPDRASPQGKPRAFRVGHLALYAPGKRCGRRPGRLHPA
ncbi:MAG: hypothetical protein P8Z49_09955 [Acidobacteriota bacterium]